MSWPVWELVLLRFRSTEQGAKNDNVRNVQGDFWKPARLLMHFICWKRCDLLFRTRHCLHVRYLHNISLKAMSHIESIAQISIWSSWSCMWHLLHQTEIWTLSNQTFSRWKVCGLNSLIRTVCSEGEAWPVWSSLHCLALALSLSRSRSPDSANNYSMQSD